MKRRGVTLVEVLVAGVILVVLLGAFLTFFLSMSGAQKVAFNLPPVQQNARQMVLTVASAIRRASPCGSGDSGCTLNAGLETGPSASSSIVVYGRDTNGVLTKTSYANSGSDVVRNETIWYPGASLTFNYFRSTSYHGQTLESYSPPSSTGLTDLIAVQIVGTVTSGDLTATYTTIVRLRNLPPKLFPSD